MRKEFLTKKLSRLQAKLDKLSARSEASTDAAEVRKLGDDIFDLAAEIAETRDELKMIEDAEARAAEVPADAQLHNGNIIASFQRNAPADTQQRSNENPYESREYREAFMAYAQRGERIPAELISRINEYRSSLPQEMRAGVPITTADTGAAIPFTVMREVINTIRKRYGNLYAKVRKTNVTGGVEYPVGALEANFKWINEDTVSPRQKIGAVDKVVFNYHTAEIRVAQTFLSNLLTIEAFEMKITEVIAVAYAKAMDIGIVKGSGNGQMTGILNDARVAATGNAITMSAADMGNWTAWRKKFFAKLPLGYRNGEFIFTLGTVDTYLETMADANNNPIFRQATGLEVNDGDALNPNGRFFGRGISLVEPDVLPDFDSAESNDVIGIFWQPEEYAINENFGFTMRRYFDEETNEWVDKALVVVDGKVLNPNGIWLIKKA